MSLFLIIFLFSTDKKCLEDLHLDELDELEDEEDEKVLLEYRAKRIAEIKALAEKAKYGEVREISAEDYIEQVNRAGDGVWVVLHLFKQGSVSTIFFMLDYCTYSA